MVCICWQRSARIGEAEKSGSCMREQDCSKYAEVSEIGGFLHAPAHTLEVVLRINLRVQCYDALEVTCVSLVFSF